MRLDAWDRLVTSRQRFVRDLRSQVGSNASPGLCQSATRRLWSLPWLWQSNMLTHGVLHRDLKPGNILLQPAHDEVLARADDFALVDFQPRIADFSLANIAGALIVDARTGSPFGSPPYMAPEQAQGRLAAIGPPTDIYALGCILYELLTGKPPFRGKGELDTLRQVIADQPIPPNRWRRKLSAPLHAIVMKCLEKNPDDRYTTARSRRRSPTIPGGRADSRFPVELLAVYQADHQTKLGGSRLCSYNWPLGCGITGPITLVQGPGRTDASVHRDVTGTHASSQYGRAACRSKFTLLAI